MKAVICALHSSYIHSALAPWYLLEGVKAFGQAGITAEVVEGTVNMEVETVAELLISKKPQVVGFGCYIWNISFVKKLLPILKKALPDAVMILGGPEVSFNTADVLDALPQVDYVIAGEGERPFAQLLNALDSGLDVDDIPGVCYRVEGLPVVKPSYCPSEYPPSPYSEAYFQALGGRIAYLETSRGCPFNCAFCLSGREEHVRFFPLERAERELVLLANSGTKTVKLVDRTFNADRRRARNIFKFIIDSCGATIPKGVCFHFEIAGDLLDDETFELLKTAPPGLIQFEIGLQSFNGETLEALNRKTDITQLKSNIERLIEFGNIHIHVDLIAGLPYEDLRSFADSFNTAYALRPHMLQLGFLKLLHGSAMREEPERFPCAFSNEPPYMVTGTPWLSADELLRLCEMETVLDRLYNSGRFKRTLTYVLAQTRKTPFELFWDAGGVLGENTTNGMALDELTALTLEYYGKMQGVDKLVLRDYMVCDRLATNASGKLPVSLQVSDKRLGYYIARQKSTFKKEGGLNGRQGYAILYSQNVFICVRYDEKDPVTGEFGIFRHSINLD